MSGYLRSTSSPTREGVPKGPVTSGIQCPPWQGCLSAPPGWTAQSTFLSAAHIQEDSGQRDRQEEASSRPQSWPGPPTLGLRSKEGASWKWRPRMKVGSRASLGPCPSLVRGDCQHVR